MITHVKILAIASLGAVLMGCETSGAIAGASKKGMAALSCSEIYSTFGAYERDKTSIEAAKQLATALGIPYTGGSGETYYNTAKTTANVALMTQGCNPL